MAQDVFQMAHTLTIVEPIFKMYQKLCFVYSAIFNLQNTFGTYLYKPPTVGTAFSWLILQNTEQ